MTTGPTEGKCANPAGGPGGMPLALRLSEGLGITRAATCAVLRVLRIRKSRGFEALRTRRASTSGAMQ
jgi:hypothetical protein